MSYAWVDINLIPDNWFLYNLVHVHTDIEYRGDKHFPKHWECILQHIEGGKLTTAKAKTPSTALRRAVKKVRENWPDK